MTLLEPPARILVRATRIAVARRLALSTIAQLALVAIAGSYIMFGALRTDPFAAEMRIRVQLNESGGLLAGQDVTLRGVPIGKVQSVDLTDSGVQAVARIDATVRIPRDGTAVRVSGLSPAGEQYLDFAPTTVDGPVLTDGSVITRDQTTIPVPLWRVLSNIDGLLAQTDPVELQAIVDELGVGPEGPEKLRQLLTGSEMLISTLDGVLPQTMTLLRSSRTAFQIVTDSAAGMRSTTENLTATLAAVGAKDAGLRRLLELSPKALGATDTLLADNSRTMVQLIGNLATVAQLSYVRVPALTHLLRDERGSVLEAVTSIMHEGGVWAVANLYFRHYCDYPHPRDVPFQPDYPEPYMYTYCANDDPALLIRGARNAPRPPGDDTAGPPPGYDPMRRTDPTPIGPYTIPLPYGGPTMPPQSEPQLHGGN
ncbi:MCE family protein [Nocardia uniformis]|uniref:MCE family protein n=1 Tax=Nocardia uniformis TaxID=53432 RepID=A0A849C0M0_9NOCA|nr:MlaD family protein [Nocardia uniformis]NNH68539.1 MCE family protein [Nocardia uniformis]